MSGPVGQKTAPTCFAHAKRVALWRGVLRWVGCDGSLHDSFPRCFAHAFPPSRFAALQHARNPWPAPCRRSSQQWSALCRLGHTYQLTGTITEDNGRGWIVARRYSVMALSPEAPARSEEVGWPLAVHACSVCDGGYLCRWLCDRYMDDLIMEYFVVEGDEACATAFAHEAGFPSTLLPWLKASPRGTHAPLAAPTDSMEGRVAIRNAILAGRVEEAVTALNRLDEQVCRSAGCGD